MSGSGATSIARTVRDLARQLLVGQVRPHPAVERISSNNVAWARRFELVTDDLAAHRLAAIRCGSFAAHVYPTADEELVQLGADLIAWLFLFDDLYGEGSSDESLTALKERLRGFEGVLRTRELPREPTAFHRALLNLRERALVRADESWLERFANAMAAYFHGCELELPHRLARVPPDPLEYRRIRTLSIGGYPVFALIELETGLLDREEDELPIVQEARSTAALLCAWVNDIYSYPKEQLEQEPLNLVATLAHHYALPPEEAVAAAVKVFRTDLAMLEHQLESLRNEPFSTAVIEYVRGLERWVRGNSAWTGLCGRY